MTTRADLQALLTLAQIQAFLRVIREGESTQNDDAYSIVNGGAHFTDFTKHPYAGLSTLDGGKAAGAYQFIPHTWGGLVANFGFTGFTPEEQDEGAVALIVEKGAVDSIKAGYVAEACAILKSTWISLPPQSVAHAERVFVKYGGVLPVTVDITQPTPEPQPETPMGFLPFLPFILQLIPALGKGIPALGQIAQAVPVTGAAGGSPHAADYMPLIQTIVDTFTKAVPAAQNPAMAVGMAQADPAVAAEAAHAVLTQPDVAAQMTALAPTLDKIHGYDKDLWAAQIAGANAASARAAADAYDVAPPIVTNIIGTTWLILGGLVFALVVAIGVHIWVPDAPDYVNVIIALAGPLFGQIMKERGTVISYRFDGTPTSNATAMANQQIANINAGK